MNIAKMEKVLDKQYSSEELMKNLLVDSHEEWKAVFGNAKNCGVSFSLQIDSIDDYTKFVQSYITHILNEDWVVTRTDPTKHNDIPRGHPDYRIDYEGEMETDHVDDVIFLEYKASGDQLRRSQIQWMLENSADGRDVWIMWVGPTKMEVRG